MDTGGSRHSVRGPRHWIQSAREANLMFPSISVSHVYFLVGGRGANPFLNYVGLFKGGRPFHHFLREGLCNIRSLLTNSWRGYSPDSPLVFAPMVGRARVYI